MSALSVRLPNSLHRQVRELAQREGISINQFVATALAEKLSALLTEEYLEARATRGRRTKFLQALAQVPSVEPPAFDRMPPPARDPGAQPPIAGDLKPPHGRRAPRARKER